ncbi:hypothetical protein [Brevundimonas sp.]|uniref:hypothetical protein n=1 Tax=Brevundimonas sp. TaxID=1871086 RepID=UPI0025C11FF2|nr:hypothetical protein [Brevundimonas sp.]
MSDLKTRPTDASVEAFLDAVEQPRRREDARVVSAMLAGITGEPPVTWGPSIIGFGRYTYVNTTKKPADWPVIGLSPRKANLSVYITGLHGTTRSHGPDRQGEDQRLMPVHQPA